MLKDADAERLLLEDAHAMAKLKDRLSLHEYCCYMVRHFANNLDAFARAKAAPKTKTYALDADATEDPTIHRAKEGGTEVDPFDDTGLDDLFEDESEGNIKSKPGDAPDKGRRA